MNTPRSNDESSSEENAGSESEYSDPEFVIVTAETTPVKQVARAMRRQDVGSVIIVEGIEPKGIEGYTPRQDSDPVRRAGSKFIPVGIVTDRDIVLDVVSKGLDPEEVSVGEIMSEDPVTAQRGEGLRSLTEKMDRCNCRRLPILEDDELVDIVSMDDLMRILSGEIAKLANLVRTESSFRKLKESL